MKILNAILACGLMITLAGCATSSKVQEMIDASQRDFLNKSATNASSINVLKQTARASLEKDSEHAAIIRELEQQLAEATAELGSLQKELEATKVISSSSVIRMSELKQTVGGNRVAMDAYVEKMHAIDELYKEVMITHFKMVVESASAAIATLDADNIPDDGNAAIERDPVLLSEPIEIVAPDTSVSTNDTSAE